MKLKQSLSMLLLAIGSLFALGRKREEVCNVNANTGTTPQGILHLTCETAAITTRYLLVQKGSTDTNFIANVATTRPWGPVLDEAAVGDIVAVALLGSAPGTLKMVANAAITVGSPVYTAAAGKVSPTFGATLYMVGRAVTAAAADGDVIEVTPCFPLLNSASL